MSDDDLGRQDDWSRSDRYGSQSYRRIDAEHAEWMRTRRAALLQLSNATIAVLHAAGSAIDSLTEVMQTYRDQLEREYAEPAAPEPPDQRRPGRSRRIDVSD